MLFTFLNYFMSMDQSAKYSSNEFLLIAKSLLITMLIIWTKFLANKKAPAGNVLPPAEGLAILIKK